MPKCKITVVKRSLNKDLIEEFIDDAYKDIKPCDIFKDGQEIIIDPNLAKVLRYKTLNTLESLDWKIIKSVFILKLDNKAQKSFLF